MSECIMYSVRELEGLYRMLKLGGTYIWNKFCVKVYKTTLYIFTKKSSLHVKRLILLSHQGTQCKQKWM